MDKIIIKRIALVVFVLIPLVLLVIRFDKMTNKSISETCYIHTKDGLSLEALVKVDLKKSITLDEFLGLYSDKKMLEEIFIYAEDPYVNAIKNLSHYIIYSDISKCNALDLYRSKEYFEKKISDNIRSCVEISFGNFLVKKISVEIKFPDYFLQQLAQLEKAREDFEKAFVDAAEAKEEFIKSKLLARENKLGKK